MLVNNALGKAFHRPAYWNDTRSLAKCTLLRVRDFTTCLPASWTDGAVGRDGALIEVGKIVKAKAIMNLRCLFGHDSSMGLHGNGISVGSCDVCGRTLVRRLSCRWYAMPRGYAVNWSDDGQHAIPPDALLRIARRRAPLQRFRRRPYSFGGYYSDDADAPGAGPWICLSQT